MAETKNVGRFARSAVSSPMTNLTERHAQKIVGVLACFDR
jgi:hypothetical protein